MRAQPPRAQQPCRNTRDIQTHDQRHSGGDIGAPVARQSFAADRGLGGEESVEDGEPAQGQQGSQSYGRVQRLSEHDIGSDHVSKNPFTHYDLLV